MGFAIGLERQITGHVVGIRINVLICMGACLFTLFPAFYGSDQVFWIDGSIISGVGFLCSGVIFKENGSVRGMNTAATLWCSAAIGILASTDNPGLAIIATTVLILSNLFLRPLAKKIDPIYPSDEFEKRYQISITCLDDAEPEIRQLIINGTGSKTLFLTNLESGDVVGNKTEVVAEYSSVGKFKNQVLEEIIGKALKNSKVVSAGWEIL